ncbi:hypothetical protein DL93DRAFT_2098481 [Clavulina sp. PMI_390]|nr:hypothetical protein DL93DRAFT_2098481 [Clavulina sp. PMI_390]
MSYRQRRFQSPSRYSRSPSPTSDSDNESYMSDVESMHSPPTEHQHVVGDMEMDGVGDVTLVDAAGDHDSTASDAQQQQQAGLKLKLAAADEENEGDEQAQKEARRLLAEKRKGKRPELSPEQIQAKAAARAERRRAREEAEIEAYRESYRPILTIKSSQGFVWNQELFIPAWQKDRYHCSTSPSSAPYATGASPASTYAGSGMEYEVECVDIRIREGELEHIVPRSSA